MQMRLPLEQPRFDLLRICPDYKPHRDLMADVKAFLEANNFQTASATYHDVMPRAMVEQLQRTFTPAALALRARADRLAMHKGSGIAFEWEAKTHHSRNQHDMTIELYPVICHLVQLQTGTDCLFAYRNPYEEMDKGFWVSKLPEIRTIFFTSREEWQPLHEWLNDHVHSLLPGVKTRNLEYYNGSGDPFLVIDKTIIAQLRSWKELILARINHYNNTQKE